MRLFVSGKFIRPNGDPSNSTPDTVSTVSIPSSVTSSRDDTAHTHIEPAATVGMNLPDEVKDQLCTAIVDALDEKGVLPLLKSLQEDFDPVGIEGLGQRAKERQDDDEGTRLIQPGSADSTNVFPDSLLADPSITELEAVKRFWLAKTRKLAEESDEDLAKSKNLRTLLVSHGISAIFKDCSIIIRFPGALRDHDQTPSHPLLEFDHVNGPRAITKIIDLDLKPMKKANKWYELDDRIWRNAVQEEVCEECSLLRRRCVP